MLPVQVHLNCDSDNQGLLFLVCNANQIQSETLPLPNCVRCLAVLLMFAPHAAAEASESGGSCHKSRKWLVCRRGGGVQIPGNASTGAPVLYSAQRFQGLRLCSWQWLRHEDWQ